MIRRSCLAGLVLSYAPLIGCAAAIGVLAALSGALQTVLWLLVAWAVGYVWLLLPRASSGRELRYRGVPVGREGQPALMAVVDGVMKRAGIDRLDGVWLVPDPGAGALIGHRDWRARRRVGVTVGLLTAMHLSADELAAVLAHEAGHLTDRGYLRAMLARRRRRARLWLKRPVLRPMRWYWRWFLMVTREQGVDFERHADAVAAQMYGDELAARAHHRIVEVCVIHEMAMERFVVPRWDERIAPATLSEAYNAIWTRMPEQVTANVFLRMHKLDSPDDTHPGLAERCGGREFPPSPSLRGDLTLAGLEELDRRCMSSLRQKERHYPMRLMTWDEIRAERAKQAAGAAGQHAPAAPAQS